MTPNEKRRPSGTALDSAVAADPILQPPSHKVTDDTVTRCRGCSHLVTNRRSVARQLGPVCAHKIAASLALPGWRVETVAADHGTIAVVLVPLVAP